MAAVWLLALPPSTSDAGGRWRRLHAVWPAFARSVRDGQVLMLGRGSAFGWWQVRPDRSWYLAFIGAWPPGRGHGDRLLAQLVTRADAAGAVLTLYCGPQRVAWYERHGFALVHTPPTSEQVAARAAGFEPMRRLPLPPGSGRTEVTRTEPVGCGDCARSAS